MVISIVRRALWFALFVLESKLIFGATSLDLTMVKITKRHIIKSLILLILCIIFFYFFFLEVMAQYFDSYTNTMKIVKNSERIELPTFSFCTGYKKSMMDQYKFHLKFFYSQPDEKSNIPPNTTLKSVFDEITFKLNKEFLIGLSWDLWEYHQSLILKVGFNEIKIEGIVYNIEVKEIPTVDYGLCYIVIPNQLNLKPLHDMMMFSIASNMSEMTSFTMQISSKETFHSIAVTNDFSNNYLMEEVFTPDTIFALQYSEEETKFIKDCSYLPFFECWTQKFEDSKEFNCTKKCIPLAYTATVDTKGNISLGSKLYWSSDKSSNSRTERPEQYLCKFIRSIIHQK